MRFDKAVLVFKKDWLEIKRNWQVILPIVILPAIISIVLPVILTLIPTMVPSSQTQVTGFDTLMQNLPANVQQQLATMTDLQSMVYIMALYFLAPFFLLIPLMASSVIASDSFAGEKERKTIEALLATPISDSELFFGKMLVSFVPSMIVTVFAFTVYSVVFDVLAFNMFGMLLLPNIDWLLMIFGLAPAVALASIGLTVIISSRVKGFREAQQISVVLMLPILGLVFGQIAGAVVFGPVMILVLAALFAAIDFAVFKVGVSMFKREEILAKLA